MTVKEKNAIDDIRSNVDWANLDLSYNIERIGNLKSLLKDSLDLLMEKDYKQQMFDNADMIRRNLYIFDDLSDYILKSLEEVVTSLDKCFTGFVNITKTAITTE